MEADRVSRLRVDDNAAMDRCSCNGDLGETLHRYCGLPTMQRSRMLDRRRFIPHTGASAAARDDAVGLATEPPSTTSSTYSTLECPLSTLTLCFSPLIFRVTWSRRGFGNAYTDLFLYL